MKGPKTVDTKDHKQLIQCHVQNLCLTTASIAKACLKNELHEIIRLVEPGIVNFQKIEQLAAQLLGEQTKGKDEPPCSPPPEKSSP